jgi:hypothetical protein
MYNSNKMKVSAICIYYSALPLLQAYRAMLKCHQGKEPAKQWRADRACAGSDKHLLAMADVLRSPEVRDALGDLANTRHTCAYGAWSETLNPQFMVSSIEFRTILSSGF